MTPVRNIVFETPIVGNPIAQVKAPGLINLKFAASGLPAVMQAIELSPESFAATFDKLIQRRTTAGVIVTTPFKMGALRHCRSLDNAAREAGAVNLMVRHDSRWHGMLTDGTGFLSALRFTGFDPAGKLVLIVGAGGAGSAIAFALRRAGVGAVHIFDVDCSRAERLAASVNAKALSILPDRLAGYHLLINATPLGLSATDPLPFDPSTADATAFIGDVIAEPVVSPLRRAAAALGIASIGGAEMLNGQIELLYAALAASVEGMMA